MLPTSGRSAVCPRRSGIVALLAAISLAAMASTPVGAAALTALVWCDHADPALLGPFEDANGVTVNVKNSRAPARASPSSSSPDPAAGT
jgi:spermidine/putrescine transport system substrate-binding protein